MDINTPVPPAWSQSGVPCVAMPLPAISCTIPLLPGHGERLVPCRLPLPGVVIFVHGVNSDGEWYDDAEQGLCKGLNTRLARQAAQLALPGDDTGRLIACEYTPELDAAGFIDPDRSHANFIQDQSNWSPVIRFRWGYKATKRDVKDFGDSVFLNEDDYWGGGPFANGCSALADLWTDGLNDRLFLWLTAQHLNPVPGREVYHCPHRAYYAFAALRLARLLKSIRDKQADCPITVVCHSQGNMVGLAAAFLADRLGIQADNYVLCNPPLSLVDKNGTEDWVQRYTTNGAGQSGRVSHGARLDTLANFFKLLKARAGCEPPAERVDQYMANPKPADGSPGFTAASDRQQWGLDGRHTHGRVTLYCNPHDQVISADSVQGIGWRGMSADEIAKTGGAGVFAQRVFAHAYPVGAAGGKDYDFWAERNKRDPDPYPGSFWIPPSPPAHYALQQGVTSNQSVVGKVLSVLSAPFFIVATGAVKARVNADPRTGWKIPINAPALPESFLPETRHYGEVLEEFDASFDPAGKARNRNRADAPPDDPYTQHGVHRTRDGRDSDAPLGNEHTEAQLRYEHRAQLRMKARRQGKAEADGSVPGETQGGSASADYQAWRTGEIRQMLKDCVNAHATDHSSILTNPMHAEKALAYDVAIGVCTLSEQDWRELRVEADWRYCVEGLDKAHPHRYLGEYFMLGFMDKKPLEEWVKSGEARRPAGIVDTRTYARPEPGAAS